MTRRAAVVSILIVAALAGVWVFFVVAPRWSAPRSTPASSGQAPPAEPAAGRKIKATLYYVSADGLSLVGAEQEIPFAEPIVAQARRIVEAQLGAAPAPLVSAIPPGTTLRSLFMTERGDAFVDLSAEVTSKHPGGALNELFTVYAVVDALTVNLPSVTRVQILVNGKEADTLAGHVDLRHPLQKNLKWLPPPATPAETP
jgi:spore germination protein GerM